MSKTGKIILWIVIVLIIVGGIWWWVVSQSNVAMAPSNNNMPANTTSTANSSSAASTSYPQGDSDQSINQDMVSVNSQLNGLSSDNASVTQSMNDQPVQQAE
jgi:cytoskeletal protein RodZ